MSVQVRPNGQNSGSALSNLFGIFNTAKDIGKNFNAKPEGAEKAAGPEWSTGASNPGGYGLSNMSNRMNGMASQSPTDYFKGANPYASDGILKSPGASSASEYSIDGAGKAAAMDGEFGGAAAYGASAGEGATMAGGAADAAGGSDAILALA